MRRPKSWTKPERVLLETLRDLDAFFPSSFVPEDGQEAAWSELRDKARDRVKCAFAAVLSERGRRLIREYAQVKKS